MTLVAVVSILRARLSQREVKWRTMPLGNHDDEAREGSEL